MENGKPLKQHSLSLLLLRISNRRTLPIILMGSFEFLKCFLNRHWHWLEYRKKYLAIYLKIVLFRLFSQFQFGTSRPHYNVKLR